MIHRIAHEDRRTPTANPCAWAMAASRYWATMCCAWPMSGRAVPEKQWIVVCRVARGAVDAGKLARFVHGTRAQRSGKSAVTSVLKVAGRN